MGHTPMHDQTASACVARRTRAASSPTQSACSCLGVRQPRPRRVALPWGIARNKDRVPHNAWAVPAAPIFARTAPSLLTSGRSQTTPCSTARAGTSAPPAWSSPCWSPPSARRFWPSPLGVVRDAAKTCTRRLGCHAGTERFSPDGRDGRATCLVSPNERWSPWVWETSGRRSWDEERLIFFGGRQSQWLRAV